MIHKYVEIIQNLHNKIVHFSNFGVSVPEHSL